MKTITQDGRRYVVRDGQRIEVEMTYEAKSKRPRQAPTGQRFAMLTEERLKLLAKVGPHFPAAWHLLLPVDGQLEGPPPASQADEQGARRNRRFSRRQA